MNCPRCALPLLFGASSCPCGYNLQSTDPDATLPIELTYWEALRAYWRTYWPGQLVLGLVLFVMTAAGVVGLLSLALQLVFAGLTLYLFVSRICSRPYRGFSLVVVDVASGTAGRKLNVSARLKVSVFLWWRQILAGMFAGLLAGPLNMVLSIMGLQVAQWVAMLAGVLVIGPILLKMLIGHEFGDFRVEARRGVAEPVDTPSKSDARVMAAVAIGLGVVAGVYVYTRLAASKQSRRIAAPLATNLHIVQTPVVRFDIKRAAQPSATGVDIFDCTYFSGGKTARFQLEFKQNGQLHAEIPLAAAKGKFIAVPGSDNSSLLVELQKALEATVLPSQSARAAELPFSAVVLGDRLSRGGQGGFADNPPGGWKSIKIFVPHGDDELEMFLNLNPAAGKGEFSMKDPEYGNVLLSELATVL